MTPPKKRLKTSRDWNSCETTRYVPPAPARPAPSAYLAIFDNGPGEGPKFCRITEKRMTFDAEDPGDPFRMAFSRLNPNPAAFPVRITFTEEDKTDKYTLRIPTGGDLLTVYINLRLVSLDARGFRLKNGDLVQFYSMGPDSMHASQKILSGPIEFQFFVSEEQQPKCRITKKKPTWEMMPPEILERIFKRVPTSDLLRSVAGTCQKFRKIVFSGKIKPPVLDVKSCLTEDDSAGIDLMYGPDGLSEVETVVIYRLREGSYTILKRLLCRLEHLQTLDLRCPTHCPCGGVVRVERDWLHPNVQLKTLKAFNRKRGLFGAPQRPSSLSTLLTSSVECCWITAPNNSNPTIDFLNLVYGVGIRPCTFVYAWANGRSKWTFRAFIVEQRVERHVVFEGVYFPELYTFHDELVRLNLTIPGKDLASFFMTFLYPLPVPDPVILRDLILRIEDDGQFDVDDLTLPRTAVGLRTLDLVVPEITEEFCRELCTHHPLLESIFIQVTSVDIPVGAMELLRNKQGLQHLNVIGPSIRGL